MRKFVSYFVIFSLFSRMCHCQQDSGEIVYTVLEEQPVGTPIGNIRNSTDLRDESLQFTLLSKNSKIRDYLSIDEASGALTTDDVIDREHVDLCAFSKDCQFPLEISARSSSGFFEIIQIILVVEDINDNAPVFEVQSKDLAISEDVSVGEVFSLSAARDADTSEQFSLRTYEMQSLSPNEDLPFSMTFNVNLDGSSKVMLKLTRLLDREKKKSYQLYIIAEDGGNPPLTGTLFVNITVLDINDNYPMFDSPSYNVTVPENVTPGTVILRISASDPDEGSNGRVTYSLSQRQSRETLALFSIDRTSGNLTVNGTLTYNQGIPYKIIVEASDGSLTNQTFVNVEVLDIANNAPIISIDKLSTDNFARISEYANLGAVVAHVFVWDEDTSTNGDVTCEVYSDGDWFGLQPYVEKQYKVIVDKTLDRERESIINVTVTCEDKGSPPKSSTEYFPVMILDENDTPPRFVKPHYFVNFPENNNIGDKIITVTAFDLDSDNNAQVSYSIAANSSKYAYVNPLTGDVMANFKFDRESMPSVTLKVIAEDGGSPTLSGTALLTLTITDVNDKKPVFEQTSFRMWVKENMPSDTLVGRLAATDNDTGVNAEVTYRMKPSVHNVPFVVFSDGFVKTDRELNREFISEYSFEVIALDSGNPPLTSSATVTVFIEDVNDQIPAISFPTPSNNTIYVPYLTSPDTIIGHVVAMDADEPGSKNSELQYSLTTRNTTFFFSIDGNGHLYLTAPVSNPDMISNLYILDVHVNDKGDNSHSVTEMLRIVITTQNGTAASPEGDSKQNFYIAVAVGAVTLVLSAGIVVTICIIRRFDARRKREQKSHEKVLSENLYSPKANDVFSLSSDRKKKEVSFSIDEDSVIDNVTMTTDKGPFRSSVPEDDAYRHDTMEHILLEPPPQYNQVLGPSTRKLDDAHSDMSGDSGTGDSGKGGSDDDLQIHLGGTSHDMLKPKERWNQRRNKGQGIQPMQPLQTFSRAPQPPAGLSQQQKIIPFSFKKPAVYPGGSSNSPRGVSFKGGMDTPMFYEENSSNGGSSGFLSLDGNLNYNSYRGDVSSDVVV